jgi:hypothetical protein
MICRYIDGSGREWYGAFPDCEPLAEDSGTKLKRSQLTVCIVYYDVVEKPA